MLVLALSATLVGFVLLVAALVSGVLWLAIACVVVCVIGVGFLIADLLGLGRSSSAATASEAHPEGDATGDDSVDDEFVDDEVGTSDQEQAGDWSATAEHEEDPAAGDLSEGHSHDRRDDPPTEEMFLDKPR